MNMFWKAAATGLTAAIAAVVLFGTVPLARATDYTWEGDDAAAPTDWSVPPNWATTTVPSAGDGAVFDPGLATGFTAEVGTDTPAARLDFNNITDAPASQFTILAAAGGGSLLLGDGSTAAEIEHDSAAATPQDGASTVAADVSAVPVGGGTRDLAFDVGSGTLTIAGMLGDIPDQVRLIAPLDGGHNVEAGGVLDLANANPAAPNNVTGTLTVAGELRVGPYGLASTTTPPAVVLAGGSAILDIDAGTTLGSAVTLGGGTVRTDGSATVTGAVTDAADMTFAAGEALAFSHDLGIALTDHRTWTVAEGTVVVAGDLADDGGGPYDLTVLGPGTLRLDSGAVGVDRLTCGADRLYGDPAVDGLTIIGDPTRAPDYVVIHNKAAYSVAADHAYDEVNFSASDGCIAIGADTTSPVAMFGPSVRLGAAGAAGDGNHTFSGTLTPYSDTYYLGGGAGTLTVAPDVLVDTDYEGDPAADPTHVQVGVAFGGSGPDDITHAGMVVMQGDDRFAGVTGDIRLDGFAGIAAGPDVVHGDALSAIDDAASVVLYPTGGLDLGDADITGLGPAVFGGSGLFDMQGGGVSRNGGTVTEDDVAELWGPQEPYGGYNGPVPEVVLGGGVAAGGPDTTTVDYGAVAADVFRKVGPNTVVMSGMPAGWGTQPGETGDENYLFEVYVEDGRLVFADDSAVGEKANLPDPIYEGTVLVTVSGGAEVEIQASDNTPAEALADFTLLDGATLVLPAAGQTYYAAGLQLGETIPTDVPAAVTLAGSGGTLNLEHVEYPDGITPTTVFGSVTAVPGSTLTVVPGAGLTTGTLVNLSEVNLGGTLTLAEGATTLNAVHDSAGGAGGGAYGTLVVGPNATAAAAGAGTVDTLDVQGGFAVAQGAVFTVRGGAYTGTGTTTIAGTLDVAAGGPSTYDGPIGLAGDGILQITSGDVVVTQDISAVAGQVTQPDLNWEAAQDPAGDDLFESYWQGAPLNVTANRTWTFTNGAQTPAAVTDPALTTVTYAYAFNAARAHTVSFEEMEDLGNGNLSSHDHSFEIIFRPSDLVGDEILLESGGATDGLQIWLSGDTLNYQVRDNDTNIMTATCTLPADAANGLHQMVGTFDMDENGTATDRISLYLDGVWVADATHTDIADWAGSNDSGLGRVNGASPTGVSDDFNGQMALVRYYDARVLTPGEVLGNYNALVGESHGSIDVAEGAGLTAARVVDVPTVNLGGTLALAGGTSTVGHIDGASPTCAVVLLPGATLEVGTVDDVCDIQLGAGSVLGVGTAASGIGMVEGGSGTLDVAAGVVFAHTSAGGFHGLDAVTLGDGAQLTTGEVTSTTGALTVGAGAVLDLTTGNLVVDYATPPAGDYSPEFLAVEALVASGFQDGPGGYWDGPGITSSAAAGSPDGSTALAVFDNAGPGGGKADLEGEPVDATSVLVKYAWYGDINLDGVVDFNDYNIIDNTFLGGDVNNQHWQRGDLNFDGVVDFNDYNLIDNTFLAHAGETLGGGLAGPDALPAPTPEPATLALLGLGAAAMLLRRRRA